MADQWLNDYEKAKANAQRLTREVDASDRPDAKKAALLRGRQAQLRQEVAHLQKSLMASSQNLTAYNITRKELARRGDLMSELSDACESLQEAVRSGARRKVPQAELLGASAWRDRGSKKKRDVTGMSEQEVLQCVDDEIATQDETLDFLSGTVANMKAIGKDISQEIDLHCRLLGEVEDQTDRATSKIQTQRSKLNELAESSASTCNLWACACCLLLVLLILLIYF